VSALPIRVRETRIDLPYDGGAPGGVVLDVPAEPMKVDRGTVIFRWPVRETDPLIVKLYGEMGVLNWLRKQVVGYRARREFRTLWRLRDAGVDCCEPMFWATGRTPERGLFEVVATREIPDAVPLSDQLPRLDPEARAETLGRLFESLARMHRAGVWHGAFFLTNVLLGRDRSVPRIIDLEKSVVFASDVRGTRMADYDLLCAVTSTFLVVGGGYARRALERYGLDEAGMARIFAAVEGTRWSKSSRYRLRFEFLTRGLASRTLGALAGWSPAPTRPVPSSKSGA
jgi:tRNA A-37 threonylcarbamoyl transferase component Bud32